MLVPILPHHVLTLTLKETNKAETTQKAQQQTCDLTQTGSWASCRTATLHKLHLQSLPLQLEIRALN